jgi:hypothetical protein
MTNSDSNFLSNNTYSNNDIKNKKINTNNLNPWSADNELTSTQQLQKVYKRCFVLHLLQFLFSQSISIG